MAVFVAPNGSCCGKEHYDPNEIEHRDEQVEHLPARLVEVVLPADGPINIKGHTGHAVDAYTDAKRSLQRHRRVERHETQLDIAP